MRETQTPEQAVRQTLADILEALDFGTAYISPGARIVGDILAVCGTLTILAGGFLAWVWFTAECVKLASRWGWLP